MILKEINVDSKQITLLFIECDCGHKMFWPLSKALVECIKCGRKELWNEQAGIEYDQYKDYKVMKSEYNK